MDDRPAGRPDPGLVPVEEARRIIAQYPLKRSVSMVALRAAAGHVLAGDIRADRDIPPFDRAAVDGYAIRLGEPWHDGTEFRVLGRVTAGQAWSGTLPSGCAVKVMTGAPVPRGANGVVRVEQSQALNGDRVRLAGPFEAGTLGGLGSAADSETAGTSGRTRHREGIAPRGEDARKGTIVLPRGARLEAPQVGILASVGRAEVPVVRLPGVAVVTTGAEVVPPSARPGAAQIRNGNGPLLETLLRRSGAARVIALRTARDSLASLRGAIRRASASDLLVFTGGVSAGDLDLVPEALQAEGFRIRLQRVAMRPGKPLLFGTHSSASRRRAVFGLPGNPVSVLVTAWEFLLPYLRAAAGWEDVGPPSRRARIQEDLRRKPGLTHFVLGGLGRDELGGWTVRVIHSNGSGDYVSAGRADCLIPLPAEDPYLQAGADCWVHPLS